MILPKMVNLRQLKNLQIIQILFKSSRNIMIMIKMSIKMIIGGNKDYHVDHDDDKDEKEDHDEDEEEREPC